MSEELNGGLPPKPGRKRGPYKKRKKKAKKPVKPRVPKTRKPTPPTPPELQAVEIPIPPPDPKLSRIEKAAIRRKRVNKVLPPPVSTAPAPPVRTPEEGEPIDPPLQKRPEEHYYSHRAFLLWCMCDPERRMKKAIAEAMGYTSVAISRWFKDYFWSQREAMIPANHLPSKAGRAYLALYSRSQGTSEVKRLEGYLLTSYPGVTSLIDGELVRSTDPDERMRKLLDQVEERIQRRVEDLTVPVGIKELEELEAAKKLRIRIESMGKIPVAKAADKNPLATSVRVERAIAKGVDPMLAIQEDHEELGMILQVMKASQELSNILPFPMPEIAGKRVRA